RDVIATSGLPVLDVDVGDAACLDVDTPDDIVAAGGAMKN
ncbi:molybdopterin-guanine dinucleotide biosynthesis protein MobA, partial [Rhizobium ruizarguesonis]